MLLALAALALGACGSGGATCAPAGTYTVTASGSANPGDCPADVELVDTTPIQVDDHDVCDGGNLGVSEGGGLINGQHCSESGTEERTPAGSRINAKVTIVSSCWGDGAVTCTAHYDVVYTLAAG
jgi:hypothetical protein